MSPRVVLIVASIGVFMAFLDDTVVAIAFPNMVRSFPSASISDLSWVLNAYNIAFAALLVPAGRFADLFGRRRLYRLGIALFTLASAACAAAPSIGFLIASRGIQGAGAALIVPASLALILEAFPPASRTQAVAMWGASAALAAGLGPSIGGLLVYAADWRLVFLINLPVGLIAWLLSHTAIVESRAPGRRELPDLLGALLLALAVGSLTLAIVEGSTWGWTSPGVLAAWLGAVVGAVACARRSISHRSPVLDLDLLRMPGIRVTTALTLVGGAGFFGLTLANTLYLMQVWRYSPLTTGLAFTVAPFVTAAAALLTGAVVVGRDPRRVIVLGATIWTLGAVLLLLLMGPHPNFLGAYLPAAVTLAVGLGMGFPLVSDAAVSGAPGGRFAVATASNTAIRQVGAAIGVAIVAALIGTAARTGTASPFHGTWIFAAICFGSVAVGALLLPRPSQQPDTEADDLLERRLALPARARRSSPPARPPVTAAPSDTPESLLAEAQLFAGLPPELQSLLASRCNPVRLAAGEWLFRAGEPAAALYVLKSGRVEVMGEPLGRPLEVMRTLGRGAVVGELALLSGDGRSASVRCRRDATLFELGREHLELLLREQPTAAEALLRTLGRQLQASRPLESARRSGSSTVAIVCVNRDHPQLEADLQSRCAGLTSTAWLRSADIGEPASAGDLAQELARALDVAEREHELVLLSAGRVRSGAWTGACIGQADRILLLLDESPAQPLAADGDVLRGCDVALLGESDAAGIRPALDELEPRVTHRISTGAGYEEDIARLARRLTGRAVGLVLSGGGARCFAHLGVIEELLAAEIVIDRVGAAGMGAFVGALLARGLDPVQIDACCYDEWVRRNPLSDYGFPRQSLVRGRRAAAMLRRALPGLIEDLPRSFYCVASDIISGELVTLRRGSLARAVEASICLPGVAPPVQIGDHLLVDGGVLENLPIAPMLDEADGPIVVSDVAAREDSPNDSDGRHPQLGLVETVTRAMLLRGTDGFEQARRQADLYIAPAHESIGVREFHMLDRMRDSGRRAALEALESGVAAVLS